MELKDFNIMCDELLKDMHGKGDHCIFLSGRVVGIKETFHKLIKLRDNLGQLIVLPLDHEAIMGEMQKDISNIAKEFKETKR